MNYFVSEGNKIGYMPTEFGSNGTLVETKLVADGDVKKGQVVYVSDSMKVKVTSAGSEPVLGVAMFDAKDGDPVAVETEGLFKLTAGASITAGCFVSCGANGKVVTTTSTAQKIGIALNDASADGDPVFVKFAL